LTLPKKQLPKKQLPKKQLDLYAISVYINVFQGHPWLAGLFSEHFRLRA
jgi:hypothetical protein